MIYQALGWKKKHSLDCHKQPHNDHEGAADGPMYVLLIVQTNQDCALKLNELIDAIIPLVIVKTLSIPFMAQAEQ